MNNARIFWISWCVLWAIGWLIVGFMTLVGFIGVPFALAAIFIPIGRNRVVAPAPVVFVNGPVMHPGAPAWAPQPPVVTPPAPVVPQVAGPGQVGPPAAIEPRRTLPTKAPADAPQWWEQGGSPS